MQRFLKGWLPAVALALALAAASAGAVSLEGRIGMAGSNYNLTEGKTEYAERGRLDPRFGAGRAARGDDRARPRPIPGG